MKAVRDLIHAYERREAVAKAQASWTLMLTSARRGTASRMTPSSVQAYDRLASVALAAGGERERSRSAASAGAPGRGEGSAGSRWRGA